MSLEKYVNDARSYSFSDEDVRNALEGKTRIITYPELRDVEHINEILAPYGNCVILYLTGANYGHWTVIFNNDGGGISYFDSYGGRIDEPLTYNTDEMNKKLGQDDLYLTKLLIDSGKKISRNPYKFQTTKKDNAECGRWVIMRLYLENMTDDEFYIFFTKNKHYDPDFFVILLTSFIN